MSKHAKNANVKNVQPNRGTTIARAGSPTPPVANAASQTRPMAKVEAKPGVNMSSTTAGQLTREAVAEAAYYLWLKRGGNDLQNWLEAEAMLRNKVRAAV